MAKSKKPKPEPKSPSPATSSPDIAKSKEPKGSPEIPTAKSSPPSPPPKEGFESYYLKRVTAEFADDIDKLRSAPDFSERSAPVLIQALKRGSKGFSEEEKEKLMNGR